MKLAKHTLCAAIVLATTSVAYAANAGVGVGVGVGVGPYVEGFTNVIATTAPNTLPDGVTAPQGMVNSLPPAQYPSDKYTSYKEKKLYGFKDTDGQVVLAPQFKAIITEFSEDRAFVRNKEGTIVAIDGTGKELFKAPSSVIFPFKRGIAAVKASGKWGLMRYDGTWVAEPVYDAIEQL